MPMPLEVIVIQFTLFLAAQAQLFPVVMFTDPVPPLAEKAVDKGEIVCVQMDEPPS